MLTPTFISGWGGPSALTDYPIGAQRIITLPQIVVVWHELGTRYRRYLVLRATNTGTVTAGAASMSLILDEQDGRTFYPSGYTIA
jgi:hypothetical protein